MSETILIVDDEEEIRDIVRTLLEMNGFNVVEAKNAAELNHHIMKQPLSLIILDIGLPESDGLTEMKKLQSEHDIPIVLLTGKGDVIDKVIGLELGADDYITKPFHSHELIARIKTVLRRTSKNDHPAPDPYSKSRIIEFNQWSIDLTTQRLYNPNSEEIQLTGHEFSILNALIQSAGRTLSREQLLDRVASGRGEYEPYDRSLDVMIAKIRRKLGDNPKQPEFIKTIRHSGYMFIADLTKNAS